MAASQYGVPCLVSTDRPPEKLDRIALSKAESGQFSEEWLQRLVFENPAVLPIDQIDSSYEGLIPICMELSTPSGYIDALLVTPKGKIVILEAKLWRNPEARREVVSQILHYAQALSEWTYENLLKQVCLVTRRKGNALYDIVKEQAGAVDEQAFIDGISRSLRNSEFLLLIVGDGIREGAGSIANFLESAGRFNFTFGLVEMAVFNLADGRRLMQPRVIAQTVMLDRPREPLAISLQAAGVLATSEVETGSPVAELTQREAACQEFWKSFLANLKLDDQTQPLANVRTWSSIDFYGPPKSNTWITPKVGPAGSDRAGVYLLFTRGPQGDGFYEALLAEREQIEQEIGLPVQWVSKDGKHHIFTERQFEGEVLAPERRAEVQAYLADAVNRFVNAFRERIAKAGAP